MDAIIAIAGCDYVTFNGIDLQENAANTDAVTWMEWGYALLKASESDGSQHITILNCNISLNITHTASIGIYSANHTTASTTALVLWSPLGANSYLKINNNTINCYTGIYIIGFNVPVNTGDYGLYDLHNEIGKDGGNIITNVGGGASIGFGIWVQYQNHLKVANNTVTSTTAGTAGSIYGIALAGAWNSSYELYGNTVSIQYSGPGSSAFYPLYTEMGALGETNTQSVYNNTVTGCTFPTYTTAQVRYININNGGTNLNVYGNVVTNNVVGSSTATATGSVYYLVATRNGPVYSPCNVYNNTITGNSRVQSTPGSGSTFYLWVSGSTSQTEIHHNTIANNVIASNGSAYGIYSSQSIGSARINDNQVTGITQANGTFQAINYSSSSQNIVAEIFRNKIDNIQGDLATSMIHGIYSQSNGTSASCYIHNNMISDLRAPAAVQASNAAINGIFITSATYVYVNNNSVYLNAASTSTNFGSSAFHSVTTMSLLELKNNIFVNTSMATGTGTTAAIRFANATLTNYSQFSNNNNLFAGTPGTSNVIFFDGTNKEQTLESFQGRVYPRETQSVTEMPPFVSITSGSTDLHLQPAIATRCESGGTPVTVPTQGTTDYDLQPRYPNSGYPVGTQWHHMPPTWELMNLAEYLWIWCLPLLHTQPWLRPTIYLERVLTATITDGSGVPVSGTGLPVLYWSINAGAYQGVQGVSCCGQYI
jgi:trimeric autotransporter adhesin